MKICTKCYQKKPLTDFYRTKQHKDGHTYDCKECRNDDRADWIKKNPGKHAIIQRRSKLKKYGLTEADYDTLLEKQGNVCAICDKPSNGKALHIDHNHETGEIRGLLCHNCNRGLGYFQDNWCLLSIAQKYLLLSGGES